MIGLHGRLSPNGLALGSTIRAGRVEFFLLWDGTGRVLAKKFGYRDALGRVVGKCKGQKHYI